MNKYDPLEEFLKKKATIYLTFAEIEAIIGDKLPETAPTDRTWWGNTMHPSRTQAQAWLNAGWKVHHFEKEKGVTFIRSEL
ncbi:DUF7662 domain-containing protein [Paenibacillus timonensis]|uniref:DUF7662 domain-containing protein n=1 Tax=Paenibacillus timonensis TaxID=225915 RepID=UPI003F9A7CDA